MWGGRHARHPALGILFSRTHHPVPGPHRATTPSRAPGSHLRSQLGPPRASGSGRTADGDGYQQSRRGKNTTYLLPSAAERGYTAPESGLIFRGGAESHFNFRAGAAAASKVHTGTCSPTPPPGPLRRRTGVTGPAGSSRATRSSSGRGPGRRVEGRPTLKEDSRRAGVAH